MNSVDMSQVVTQMKVMAAQAQSQATTIANTEAVGGSGSFATELKGAVDKVNDLQMSSKQLKTDYQLEKPGVELMDVMIAGNKAGLAFDAMVQVRNKLLDSYKEILNMPL